jgi:hypothetical protein
MGIGVEEAVSATTVRLLRAASDKVGGLRALADRLGVTVTLLSRFMADTRELPDSLLLRAVDIILADGQSRSSLACDEPVQSPTESTGDR